MHEIKHTSSESSADLSSLRPPEEGQATLSPREEGRVRHFLDTFKHDIACYLAESHRAPDQVATLGSTMAHLLEDAEDTRGAREQHVKKAWSDLADTTANPWRSGLAQLRGKESNLSIGRLSVTERTTPEEIFLALAALPSPVVSTASIHKGLSPVKQGGFVRNSKFSEGVDNPEIKDAKSLHNDAVRLSQKGKIEKAVLTFFDAGDKFQASGLLNYAQFSFSSAASILTREMKTILERDSEEVSALHAKGEYLAARRITQAAEVDASRYLPLLLHASDSAYKLEHGKIDLKSLPIDQGVGGIITDDQRAGTGNLRDCHLLVVKTLPWMKDGELIPSASYLVHNDFRSSAASGSLLDHLPDVPCVAMVVGGNSNSPHSVLNVLHALHSLAATGREVTVTKSHLFCRDDIMVTGCTYHPDSFVVTLQSPGVTHPDSLMSSGWHMESGGTTWKGARPLAFDTRVLKGRKIEPTCDYLSHSVVPEERYPLPLPPSFIENARENDNLTVAKRCITHSGINIHAGHWANETEAITRAIPSARRELVGILAKNADFVEALMKHYHLEDPVLATCAVLRRASALPLYLGENSHRAHTYLSTLMGDAFLSGSLTELFDVAFMNTILHHAMQENFTFREMASSTRSFSERLAERDRPMIVHPALFSDLDWTPKELEGMFRDVEEFKEIASTTHRGVIELMLDSGYSEVFLGKDEEKARAALDRGKLLFPEIPFFIGVNSQEANMQLVHLLADMATHSPSTFASFYGLREKSVALVRDLGELIISE